MRKRASGTIVGVGLGVIAVIFGVTLWWFQTRAYYEDVTGLDTLLVNGEALPVTDYVGIDATSSPLKRRACFRQDWPQSAASDPAATPLVAPGWFPCFDAKTLTEDLAANRAQALRIAENDPDGFDTWVAHYPDGRAYLWRQLNAKFAE